MAFGILFHGRVLAAKTIFVVSTRLHIAALTTRFRELDGEAKSVVKSLLPIMVEIACVSTGVADGVNPLPTHFIRTMAVVPPNTKFCLGVPCFHGAGARIYKIPHDMSSPLIPKIIAYGLESGKRFP